MTRAAPSKGRTAALSALGFAGFVAFALLVAPTPQFAEIITTPRTGAAIVGGAAALVLCVVACVLVFRTSCTGGLFVGALVVALGVGAVAYAQDAGGQLVRAGMWACPKPSPGHVMVVDGPGDRACVEVPAKRGRR